jgi:hypothetical protein
MTTTQDDLYDENTWEAAAHWVIERNRLADISDTYPMDDMPLDLVYHSEDWCYLAANAWNRLREAGVIWSPADMVDLLAAKQHDYGNDNILMFGAEGIRVRLWDKIARLNNLVKRGVAPANEQLTDTYKDIIGYVVLYKMVNAGTFTLPLKADL